MSSVEPKSGKIRLKRSEMKRKVANMTREQIQAAVLKKKECNARAMQIVERMIEPNVEEVWLIDNLIYINQSHFQDAVEERAIIKFCGYPLCDSKLKDIPMKQYHISTKQNKVFDITDRKNYCTNVCYRAGIFLKEQLFTSPLWLRDCEDLVDYKLLQCGNKKGSSGLEIDLGNIKPLTKESIVASTVDQIANDMVNENWNKDNEKCEESNTEVDDEFGFGQIVFDSETNDFRYKDESNDGTDFCASEDTQNSDEEIKAETSEEAKMPKAEVETEPVEDKKEETKIDKPEESKAVTNTIKEKKPEGEPRTSSIFKRKVSKRRASSSSPNPLEPLIPIGLKIEQHFSNWFTVDTLIFLFGEEKVKIMFKEFGSPLSENDFNPSLKDSYIFERYTEICKRLNILELKEKRPELPTKPLPDYKELKLEAENLEIKVKNFFKGDKVVFKDQTNEPKEENEEGDKEVVPPILPRIDHHEIMATRRQIVLDKINKTLPDIQSALNLNQFNVRPDVQKFVYTLALNANNVVLKVSEWNLVAIVLLKLFSIQNEYLSYAFMSSVTQKRVINLLLAYNLDLSYLERQVLNLTNLEQIIKNSELS